MALVSLIEAAGREFKQAPIGVAPLIGQWRVLMAPQQYVNMVGENTSCI